MLAATFIAQQTSSGAKFPYKIQNCKHLTGNQTRQHYAWQTKTTPPINNSSEEKIKVLRKK